MFTVWYRDAYYPSLFDRAWIDRANFLTDGHEAPISAVAADSYAHVFTGDEAGVVKIYSLAEQSYLDTIQLQSSPVVDLALDRSGELLAILYENIVFCYSITTKSVVKSYGNDSRSKSFRYVQFSKENEVNVSFDLEPLIWCDVHGQKLATVYKGNIIKNLIMDCQSYTKYRPNETTGGIFVSWRRKEELPTGA